MPEIVKYIRLLTVNIYELDDTIKLCNKLKVYLLRISGNVIFPGQIFPSENT